MDGNQSGTVIFRQQVHCEKFRPGRLDANKQESEGVHGMSRCREGYANAQDPQNGARPPERSIMGELHRRDSPPLSKGGEIGKARSHHLWLPVDVAPCLATAWNRSPATAVGPTKDKPKG